MAIVADFDLNSQWNDEVKAVYALARYDAGRAGPTALLTVDMSDLAIALPTKGKCA